MRDQTVRGGKVRRRVRRRSVRVERLFSQPPSRSVTRPLQPGARKLKVVPSSEKSPAAPSLAHSKLSGIPPAHGICRTLSRDATDVWLLLLTRTEAGANDAMMRSD